MTSKAYQVQAAYKRAREQAIRRDEPMVVYRDEDTLAIKTTSLETWSEWVDGGQVDDIDLMGIVDP